MILFLGTIISGVCAVGSWIATCASGIGAAISSAGSALTAFAGTAVSAIGGYLGTKGAAFMKLVEGLANGPLGAKLGPVIGRLGEIAVVRGVDILAKKLGLIDEEEQPEELGYRIEEADQHPDWQQQEHFSSLAEYYAYLAKQVPKENFDSAKLQDNREYYAVLGMAAETHALEENLKISIPETFLFEIGKSRMTPQEIRSFIEVFSLLGYGTVAVSDYLQGKLEPGEAKRITEAIIQSLRAYCPEKSENELYVRLGEMREAARDDKKLVHIYKAELADMESTRSVPEL